MKIATWNVNSLRVRLPQVLKWLELNQPDVLALQEIKLADDQCPIEEVNAAGYHALYAGQKTYNGVALFSKTPPGDDIVSDLPDWHDTQRRILGATYPLGDTTIRVLNLYVPNGQEVGSDKYAYKLEWLERLGGYLQGQLTAHRHLVVLGDFNIAPEALDVHDPALWEGRVLFSAPEREAFRRLLRLGLVDTFRLFHPEEGACFSWWDYRLNAFRRNLGLRIDHILASAPLASCCTASAIDTTPRGWERPSDHTPVTATFDC